KSALALLSITLLACGGAPPPSPPPAPPPAKTTCDRLRDLSPAHYAGSCAVNIKLDFVSCDAVYESCTDAGKRKLDEYASCMEALSPCTTRDPQGFVVTFQMCAEKLTEAGALCAGMKPQSIEGTSASM